MRIVPDPALTEAAWRIVRRRYEAGDFESEYRDAFERLHNLVPITVREATAGEEVVEALSKILADRLEGALQDYLSGYGGKVAHVNPNCLDSARCHPHGEIGPVSHYEVAPRRGWP